MPIRNNQQGKVFGYIEGQTNNAAVDTPEGQRKTQKIRSGQRANLVKLGIPKKIVKKIIQGK